jgi:hypothetical protein
MISPETRVQIRRYFYAEHCKIGTIATALDVHPDTVRRTIEEERFQHAEPLRPSILDPYLPFTTAEDLGNKLEEACGGIRICPPHGQRRLGILFANPYIVKSQKASVNELLDKWLAAMKSVKCSCSAWVFPAESRYISGQAICPGAAVLIKEVRH